MSELRPDYQMRAVIDPDFNALVAEGFLCGMYTLLLGQAIWKLSRKENKRFYSLALILLWISVIVAFVSNWVITRDQFAIDNSSLLAIFLAPNTYVSMNILWAVAILIIVFIADAILIWRCNVMWGNAYILGVLVVLLVATTGLTIANTVVTNVVTVLLNSLRTLMSFLTVISATSLVVLKIVLVTRSSHMRHSYTKPIVIFVESAALVSIVLFAMTVLELDSYVHAVDMTTTSGRVLYQISVYLAVLQAPITGIAPTLIAFRVALEPSQTDTISTNQSGPLSRLTFKRTTNGASAHTPALSIVNAVDNGGYDIGTQAPAHVEAQIQQE